jgi:hypothetical protein
MTSKLVKNEQWYVRVLINKIINKDVVKPKFQRKHKWDVQPRKENKANQKSYIEFLFKVKNSVHAITFGQTLGSQKITNIDGNNRLNAIKHFIDKPFDIFPEYLHDLFMYLDTILEKDDSECLKNIFKNISYNDMVDMKFNKYFATIDMLDFYIDKLQKYRDAFDDLIEPIQTILKINGSDRFDTNVSVNVNLFEGYNTDELCQTFEAINKFDSKLTEIELLACSLYNSFDFTINDNIIETAIINEIIEHYNKKRDNEVLICYNFEKEERLNAFDFIIGFQDYCNSTYDIIEKSDNDGLSLFFKLYKSLFNGLSDTFTTEHVNNFIEYILFSCNILKKIYNKIFTEQINTKLFNKACENKFSSLKKNNIYIILSAIIGFKKKSVNEKVIIKSIEKAILFHFFVNELKDVDKREVHKINDLIQYEAGGAYIDTMSKKIINEPNIISDKVTRLTFTNLINDLYLEGDKPILRLLDNGSKKCNKRRDRKFFEKCLLFYYYKEKVPTNFLDNKFSLEHIYPFSSNWDGELDIDRFGNTIPIIDEINNKRSNNHITKYVELDEPYNFIKFIDVIPNKNLYDNIISHSERIPKIFNRVNYNENCNNNEKKYLENLLHCLFT